MQKMLCILTCVLAGGWSAAAADTPKVDRCRECHAILDGPNGEAAKQFTDDVHAKNGLTCADCHGGDSSAEDVDKSMDRKKGFRGIPQRAQIPELCARCHSDGAYMRAYNPSLRTDQLAQYWTSVHGKRLRASDLRVAVCTDCHSAHGIRPASSSLSTVNPLHVPVTCGRCHADAAYMKPYQIPTDQLENYRASVHYQTLQGGDLSAPTCATCHGNHGAAPPGMGSVERVCGTCHVFQERLFDQGPHKNPWQKAGIPGCITCHSNHAVLHTSDAFLGTGSDSLCLRCHSADDAGGKVAGRAYAALSNLDSHIRQSAAILDRAERAGMDVADARVVLYSGREKLIKARVDVHALDPASIEESTAAGMKLAASAFQAGQQALAERAFRRKGLALSLIVIGFVILSLWLFIRELEGKWSRQPTP